MRLHGIKRLIVLASILCAFIYTSAAKGESAEGEKKMTVSAGKEVVIEYTLKLEDKSVIDTNVGAEPLIYVHGSKQIILGLEKGLDGMQVGESKEVVVQPDEGYGMVDQEAIIEVKKEELPPEGLKVGAHIQGEDANGRILHAQVKEIKDQTVILDFNHPLAGKTLYFNVKIVNIQEGR